MANFKKRKSRNRCAGCKMCKPWKILGVKTDSVQGEKFSDHKRRKAAQEWICEETR